VTARPRLVNTPSFAPVLYTNIDLSECQLTQIPDAIFLLMKNTSLQSCNLAGNLITKIPTKLATNFSLITELNLSNNRISALPSEITNCSQLEKLDISSNSFVQLPSCLTELPQLKSLNASKNFVAEVEIEAVLASSLEILNLEENPLSKSCYEEMCRLSKVRVVLSPREHEDWEDLSI
jgi:Leucine-rich repeat (LRR) protein